MRIPLYQARQPAHQIARMPFNRRVALAAQDLDHLAFGNLPDGMHLLHHREQRSAPRAHADYRPRFQGALKKMRRGGADRVLHAFLRTVWRLGDDDLGKPEFPLQQFLKIDESPSRRTYRCSNDALLLGPLQKSTDGTLRYIQAGRDLKLSPSLLIVHPSHFSD